MPMPTPIPLPENFPVTWDDPMESMLLWEQEQLHLPHAVTPLGGELAMMALGPNITAGLHDLGAPVEWVKFKVINGYIYSGAMPNFALIEGAEERVKAVVGERGFTMYDRWLDTYLPEIEAGSAEVLSWDLAAASNEALGRYVERTIELLVRAFYIHFQLFPGFYTASAFADACKGMLGISDLEAFEMIQGAENLSVTSGSKLWRLAHGAPLNKEALETSCVHSSQQEKRAADAERASVRYKQAEYLLERIGQTFEGVISGLTNWGIYVELRANKCEGMIPLRDLPGDSFKFDQTRYMVTGQRTGQRFRLGDELLVTIRGVDMDKRTVELAVASGRSAEGARPHTNPNAGKWDETRPAGTDERARRRKTEMRARERQRRSQGRGKKR